MGNLNVKREKDRRVKFLRNRDKWQFRGGCVIFTIGCYITVLSAPKSSGGVFAGCFLVFSGAILISTSRLCMKV